mgnify:FL=1
MEMNYIVRELELKQTAVFDVLELYKLIKNWVKENKYSLFEREYENIKKELLSTKIKLEASKKIDEYTRYVIGIKFNIMDYEEAEVKNKKLVKGEIRFLFESHVDTDYEDRLENRPIRKFLRAIYDRLIARDKYEKYEKELKDDTYNLYNEIKAFLNLYKLK